MKVFKIQIMESTFFQQVSRQGRLPLLTSKTSPQCSRPPEALSWFQPVPWISRTAAALSSPSLCSELGKRNGEVGQQQEESPPGNRGKSGLHNDRLVGCIMIGMCVRAVEFPNVIRRVTTVADKWRHEYFFQPRLFEMTVSLSGFH